MATNVDAWPPSGSIMGLEGGLLSRYVAIMPTHGRPLAPTGAGGWPFVPICGHYDDDHGAKPFTAQFHVPAPHFF